MELVENKALTFNYKSEEDLMQEGVGVEKRGNISKEGPSIDGFLSIIVKPRRKKSKSSHTSEVLMDEMEARHSDRTTGHLRSRPFQKNPPPQKVRISKKLFFPIFK